MTEKSHHLQCFYFYDTNNDLKFEVDINSYLKIYLS
jgi:hypothetical protein